MVSYSLAIPMVATISVFKNIFNDRKCGQKNTSVCFNCTAMSSFNRKGQNRLNLSYLKNALCNLAGGLLSFLSGYQPS